MTISHVGGHAHEGLGHADTAGLCAHETCSLSGDHDPSVGVRLSVCVCVSVSVSVCVSVGVSVCLSYVKIVV